MIFDKFFKNGNRLCLSDFKRQSIPKLNSLNSKRLFMYGVETWIFKARERQRIDAVEMWCWRRTMRIPWTAKRTNVSIPAQLGVSVYQRLLTYFEHIMRRGNYSLEKIIVTGNT
ncbi:jg6527 [Pararge aegeria aegeria]|uniref:Jg6527 protein n=1 Tax=Pararge aegeria aegeria TaxID=348720 RepID=A0A8S4S3B4_9NEOP|nr:jg6527 [Pararge aegeria aegeria]